MADETITPVCAVTFGEQIEIDDGVFIVPGAFLYEDGDVGIENKDGLIILSKEEARKLTRFLIEQGYNND